MKFESSEARNSAAAAISRGSPKRPIGVTAITCLRISGVIGAVIGVSMKPGALQLTRMPCPTTSFASAVVNEMQPALAAEYDTENPRAVVTEIEQRLMMRPDFFGIISFNDSRVQ